MELLAAFYIHPSLFLLGLAILGLIVGSFLNVVIYRLPIILDEDTKQACSAYLNQPSKKTNAISLWQPRSFCPSCHEFIRAWMNIPILSYLLLRGKCFYCRTTITPRYLFVEIISCLMAITLGIYFGPSLKLIASLFFMWSMIVLMFIDVETKELPDQITLMLLWMGLFFNTYEIFTPLPSAVIGAIVGYLFFFVVAWLYRKVRKREGLGEGDFKLLASLGAWYGWQALPLIIFIGSLLGSIFSIIYIFATKQSFNTKIPFGPFLVMGGMIMMFWGNYIYNFGLFLHSYL